MPDPAAPLTGLNEAAPIDDPDIAGGPSDEPAQIDLDVPPVEYADEPARGGRTRAILLIALLVAVTAGVLVAAVTGWGIWAEKDSTLVAPAEVAGLRLDDSEDGRANADYLRTALAADVDLDQTVGAVYADSARRPVLFFGGTALIWSPDRDLDAALELISDGQGAVTGVHDVPPGRLGGTMRCGTTKTDDGDMPVCGWADHGSLALAMFPGRSESEAATLMREIRATAQTRS